MVSTGRRAAGSPMDRLAISNAGRKVRSIPCAIWRARASRLCDNVHRSFEEGYLSNVHRAGGRQTG
jgi:hypothetical protein